jgi:hypothetical protein
MRPNEKPSFTKTGEMNDRPNIDKMLVEAVRSGAKIIMNKADWISIRKEAKSEARKTRSKK